MPVAVLFAHRQSVYKSLANCDVFDIDRDARNFGGGMAVIAHPPCRAWGRLRQFAKPRLDEKELAVWAVDVVRRCGGVLEHPEGSTLWPHCNLPIGKSIDAFGGFTVSLNQSWFGHPAQKSTWLYICGVGRRWLPAFSPNFRQPLYLIAGKDHSRRKYLCLPASQREHTPRDFANWLVEVANLAQHHRSVAT